jgi:L-asparaginase/Glu-tRNA(Gln) amidotransferase subunit D
MTNNNIKSKPNLYIVLTGGTVGGTKDNPDEATRYNPTDRGSFLLVESLTKAYPNLKNEYNVKVITLNPLINSQDISMAYISKNIYETLFNLTSDIKEGDCFAISHGTDNTEASITALDMSEGLRQLKQKIAIGLWGAMHTPDSDTPDGPSNFANLIRYFSSQDKKAGIFASFSEQIQPAICVRKKHAREVDTFKLPHYYFDKIKQKLSSIQFDKSDFIHLHMPNHDEFAQIEIIHPYMHKSEIDALKSGITQGKIHGLILENTGDISTGKISYSNDVQELLKFASNQNICITQTHTEYAYYVKYPNISTNNIKNNDSIKITNSYGLSTEKVHIIMAMGLAKINKDIIKSADDLDKIYQQRTDGIVIPDIYIPKNRIDFSKSDIPAADIDLSQSIHSKNSTNKFNIKVIRNHISMYPEMLNAILDDINQNKIHGVVLEGPGNGTYNCQLQGIIDKLQEKNIPLIVSSMCRGYINTVAEEHGIGSSGIVTEDCIKLLNHALIKKLNKQQTHELFEKYRFME